MRRVIVAAVVLIVVVAALTAGMVWWANDSGDGWSGLRDRLGLDAQADTISASGYLEGRQITLVAELAGRVKRVEVAPGDQVDEGDVLVVLEDEATSALARQAEAALAAAEAQRDLLEQGARPEQIASLEAASDEARRAADAADATYRAAQAAGQPSASVSALQAKVDVAQAARQVAEAQLALANAGPSSYQVRAAEAAVKGAEARVRAAEIVTDHLTVRAPIAGTVSLVLVRAGETVAQGQALARVARTDPLEVVVYVPESELDRFELGQSVDLTVEGDSRTYDGEVVAIAESAEYTPKNVQTNEDRENLVFAVTVRVPNERGDLRPGLPVDAVIDVS